MEDPKIKLARICTESMAERSMDSDSLSKRLENELREIDNQAEYDYFLDLYERGAKFSKNENNLLVAYLLGLADDELEAAVQVFFVRKGRVVGRRSISSSAKPPMPAAMNFTGGLLPRGDRKSTRLNSSHT